MKPVSGQIEVMGNQLVFVPDEPLEKNQRIRVVIKQKTSSVDGLELEDDVCFYFLTQLDPFYSTVTAVRSAAGGFLDDVADDQVALQIHYSSKYADQISARPYGSQNDWFPGERQMMMTNVLYFREFVTCDAAIRLLLHRTATHMAQRSQAISIGPLQVREPASITQEVKVILDDLQVRRTRAERMLRLGDGSYAIIRQIQSFQGRYPYSHRNQWRSLT